MKKLFYILVLSAIVPSLGAQDIKEINPKLLHWYWPTAWISCPDAPQREYGVYHFRKTFNLDEKPDKFIVNVSADNRYRLFVNGKAVCSGPARGDIYSWYFETIDIAPYLQKGVNCLAATVWNMGTYAAVAQITNQTAFVVQGNGELEKVVNTKEGWKVLNDISYKPCSTDNGERLKEFMVIGPGDKINAVQYPWGWEQTGYNDSAWKPARILENPVAVAGYGQGGYHWLTPRNIPLMEESLQRIPTVRRATGMEVSSEFLKGKKYLQIPANKTVSVLLDQSFNTVAYPELLVSGGKGSTIKITYAEALFDKNHQKGNRNEIEGKKIEGNYDIFEPDGGSKRLFRPLWFKTYRYIQLDIVTKSQPLIIEDFYGIYTGYPFKEKASFTSDDKSLQDIWNVGWRTARLCAGETYFDCPYYEQLQYVADTRIQALISLYVTGDDRLMRKAILNFANSRVPEGLTMSRYPTNRLQVIPPFSLFWISMVHDYWMNRKDDKFVSSFLIPITGILDWFEKSIDQDKKMLGPLHWWSFADWSPEYKGGYADGGLDGNSSVLTFQYIYTLRQAADLFKYFGKLNEAAYYEKLADELGAGAYNQCFDTTRRLIANTPQKDRFSQHAAIMAVLSGSVKESEQKEMMQKILDDKSLIQATIYYRFYLTLALKKAGMADLYYSQLQPWRDMLKVGLTTFAEKSEPTRSDCHAWSASPNYDFLATICGIMPDKPGFSSVRIEPALGELQQVKGVMPHPEGDISVSLQRKGTNGIIADISLPGTLTGVFVWKSKEVILKSGAQKIEL